MSFQSTTVDWPAWQHREMDLTTPMQWMASIPRQPPTRKSQRYTRITSLMPVFPPFPGAPSQSIVFSKEIRVAFTTKVVLVDLVWVRLGRREEGYL